MKIESTYKLFFITLLCVLLTSCGLYKAHIKANLINSDMHKLYAQGKYEQARIKAEQVLELRRDNLGAEHRYVATTLNDLAEIYNNLGLYEQAKPLYEQANAIWEKNLGSEHRYLGTGLNNLASLYFTLGDYDKVEPLLTRALNIRRQEYGEIHHYVAQSYNNLAMYYQHDGQYQKANTLYQQALDIYQQLYDEPNAEVGQVMENLAGSYQNTGDYHSAENLYLKALKIKEQTLGLNHPDVGLCLNNLGFLYVKQGEYAKADPLLKRAIKIFGQEFNARHPLLALAYGNLARLQAGRGDYLKAQTLYQQALKIDANTIGQVLSFTSEQEKLAFLSKVQSRLNIYISLVNQHLAHEPDARIKAFNALNQRKGLILKTHQKFMQALFNNGNKKSMEIFRQLSVIRSQISRQTFAIQKTHAAHSLDELSQKKELLESRLRNVSKEFKLNQQLTQTESKDIAQALPENSVLIEFAKIDRLNFSAKNNSAEWRPAHYLAFIVHAHQEGEVALIDLGDAHRIDEAIAAYKKSITDPNDLQWRNLARKSYDLIFAPLQAELKDAKEVFISPEGNLSLIPFEVLLMPDKHFLIEKYHFNYLANGNDLLRFNQFDSKTGNALIMGAPDFELNTGQQQNSALDIDADEHAVFHFSMLPETEKEAKAIASILGRDNSDMYLGKQALESVLLNTKIAPSILHLATHGFFLDDLNWQDIIRSSRTYDSKFENRKLSNPLLRSGFALSGANKVYSDNELHSDGIVTAEKVLGLKLRGTQMVVLSACETGLGDVQRGEGIYGLRRAFTQVGAKSLVMSMWSVPDIETRELMVEFYQNIASKKMSRSHALRAAILEMKKNTHNKYGHSSPLYWGAFVFMGEP